MHKTLTRRKSPKKVIYNDLTQIRDAFATTGRDIKEMAGDAVSQSIDDVKARSLSAQKSASNLVKRNPLGVTLAATATGVLFGYFLNNK